MPETTTELRERRAGSLIRRPPVYIRPDATLRTVAEVLDEEQIGALLVRDPDIGVEGIVSERDLIRSLADGCDPDEERARDVMTQELETIEYEDSIADIVAVMVSDDIRHLPIVREGEIVGVVSTRSLARALGGELTS